jgi:hypothetical protein
MRTREPEGYVEALGCAELARIRLVNTLEDCEVCHSAERYATFALGPCRATLPDGREAFVCCSSKKQLLRAASPEPSRNGET